MRSPINYCIEANLIGPFIGPDGASHPVLILGLWNDEMTRVFNGMRKCHHWLLMNSQPCQNVISPKCNAKRSIMSDSTLANSVPESQGGLLGSKTVLDFMVGTRPGNICSLQRSYKVLD